MKYWMRMGLAAMVLSLMMGYGQVSAQVHDTSHERVGSIYPMSDGEVGVPLGEFLAAEKKRKKRVTRLRQSSMRCLNGIH
ncbi:hypothetical protein [Veillonella sp. 3891]|uniref:hypothetical protein n=1 Tax=Veillonella sp. 3891 TaxID=2490951 RepID=UPI000F8F0045|nr:hypothetical protein [Veillonella sp. 3891]